MQTVNKKYHMIMMVMMKTMKAYFKWKPMIINSGHTERFSGEQ